MLVSRCSGAHPGGLAHGPDEKYGRAGRRVGAAPTLVEARAHAAAERARLPEGLRDLGRGEPYPVRVSPAVRALAARLDGEQGGA